MQPDAGQPQATPVGSGRCSTDLQMRVHKNNKTVNTVHLLPLEASYDPEGLIEIITSGHAPPRDNDDSGVSSELEEISPPPKRTTVAEARNCMQNKQQNGLTVPPRPTFGGKTPKCFSDKGAEEKRALEAKIKELEGVVNSLRQSNSNITGSCLPAVYWP